jgi:hypothetical protein
MPVFVVAFCLFLAAAAGPLVALAGAAARPPAPGDVMLVVAPADRRAAALSAAGARPVGPAGAPLAGLAAQAGPGADPGLPRRLRAAGAWLVLDGTVLARLCGVAP